ncbi:MAG: hypothetical protein IT327_16160 [Anaerolineae bacterium]|nr:hypothetical protein [Anaerolineae bacterium]
MNLRFKMMVYRYRLFFSALLLLATSYFVVYTWVALPPLILMIGWQTETEMRVMEVVDEAYRPYLTPGDVVLAVDGRPAQRREQLFPAPVQASYDLTFQRDEVVITQTVPTIQSSLYNMWRLTTDVLALAMWTVGFLTVLFARPGQTTPLFAGLGFQLTAAGIVSPGPSQMGAPGAWLIGQVLIWFFPLIVLYLGFLPRYMPLPPSAKSLLRSVFYLLCALALLEVTEVLFLYPGLSFRDVTGLALVTILIVCTGAAILTAGGVLLFRLFKAPKGSYERQQLLILFVFLTLALTPLFVFVILPIRQTLFVPYPFIYSLLLLAPVGYFFVLHRQGHLALDPLFSRIITIVVLTMAVGMAYFSVIFLLQTVFQMQPGEIGRGTFLFALFGVAIIGQKRVQIAAELLLYGRDGLDTFSLPAAQTRLSANPEPATITDVMAEVAAYLQVEQTAVLVKDGAHYSSLIGGDKLSVQASSELECVILRSQAPQKLDPLPNWVELSLPITARGEMMGLLLLSRPMNGYFNARQVEILQDIADMLAFGLLVINLMEMMQLFSSRMLYEKERQRQQIATEIHNEPLHTLTAVMMQLQGNASPETIQNAAQAIRRVTHDLRRIIADLRPPALKESIEWIVRQVVRSFEETHEDIQVVLKTHVHSEKQADEQTKSAFYYILTEVLNNISKHAQATAVNVTLWYGEGLLTLEVADNGVGIDPNNQSLAELLRRHHIGLADMYRWASIGGGTLAIESNVPSGTIVKLELPI